MARYARFDFTSSDYDSIRADLITRAQQVSPEWTDHGPSNPGQVLLDLQAFVGDLIRFYEDNQANEAFLPTTIERRNVIRHLALIAYQMATAAAATASVTLTLDKAYASPTAIPQGDPILTADGTVRFEFVDRVEFPPGVTSATADVIQGETVFEALGAGDGVTPGLSFPLGQGQFLFGSETVEVDGVPWTRVVSFVSASHAAQVYVVRIDDVDDADQGILVFGDGVNGAIPDGQVAASYRTGGGEIGNVEAGALTALPNQYTTADGSRVRVSATNPLKASGGAARETTEHAKVYGPKSLATGGRSVAGSDYATNAELVPGVARAFARTSNEDPTLDENTVYVSIVPAGGGAATQTLKNSVRTQLETVAPRPITTRLVVTTAPYVQIAPSGHVYLLRSTSGRPLARQYVEARADAGFAALAAFYDPLNIDVTSDRFTANFGDRVALSTLYGLLRDASIGVHFVDLDDPTEDQVLPLMAFPILRAATRSVSVDSTTGIASVSYTWLGLGSQALIYTETPA
jgi:phage-related baseplate assembly protein